MFKILGLLLTIILLNISPSSAYASCVPGRNKLDCSWSCEAQVAKVSCQINTITDIIRRCYDVDTVANTKTIVACTAAHGAKSRVMPGDVSSANPAAKETLTKLTYSPGEQAPLIAPGPKEILLKGDTTDKPEAKAQPRKSARKKSRKKRAAATP